MNASKDNGPNQPAQSRCPICGASVGADNQTFPFCTARCRKIDLGKWLKEDYTISRPIEQRDLEEGE